MTAFHNTYQGKRVIVTGHTGFKGSWLTVWLSQLGAKVTGISNGIPTQPSMFEVLQLEQVTDHRIADVRDLPALKTIFTDVRPDFVFHLAAQPIVGISYSDPVSTIATNALGTVHVMEAARELQHPCQLILITSDKCYENVEWLYGYRESDRLGGKDVYSASKAAAEVLIHSYYHSFFKQHPNVRIASVRAGNVIGGGDWAEKRLVPDCIRAWAQEQPVEIRNPGSTRPWQHVLEPLSGYLTVGQHLATDSKIHGEAFNFGPPADHVYSVAQALDAIASNWPFKKQHERVRVKPGDFHEAGLLKLSCEKALDMLHWQPVLTFEETASFTAQWYGAYYSSSAQMRELTLQQIDSYCQLAKQKKLSWLEP